MIKLAYWLSGSDQMAKSLRNFLGSSRACLRGLHMNIEQAMQYRRQRYAVGNKGKHGLSCNNN